MKKKITSIMAATLLLTAVSPSYVTANAASFETYYYSDLNATICKAYFDDLISGNIVFFPEEMLENNEKYPVVVWANGTFCPPAMYYDLLSQISEGGYIVVTNTDLFCGNGVSQSLSVDFIINESIDPDSIFYDKVDTEHIGSAGHSQGGKSAVNSALRDSRIACVFNIAGNTSLFESRALQVPTFFLAGSSDVLIYPTLWVRPAYNVCKAPAVYGNIANADHFLCCNSPSIYSEYAINWFDAFLKNDEEAKAVFRSGGKLFTDSRWKEVSSKNI